MNQRTSSTRYNLFARRTLVILAALWSANPWNANLWSANAALADEASPKTSWRQVPPTIEIPHAATPPRLGSDDAIWNSGALIPNLSLAIGSDATLKPIATSVRLLWSQNGLYLRFDCADDTFFAPEKGRDAPIWKGDVVEVFLDAKGDARQWIELQVSPRGDLFDQMATLTTEPEANEQHVLTSRVLDRDWWTNLSWNLENWQVNAKRNLPTSSTRSGKRGHDWRVDMVVPPDTLRRLGLNEFKPMTLRMNLIRYKYLPAAKAGGQRRLLPMNWAPTMFGCPHISPQAMGFARLMPPVTASTTSK